MTKDSGQALVLIIVVVSIVLFITLSLVGGATLYFQNSTYAVNAERATALAEAGVDKAIESLIKSGGSYNGETETALGDGSYSVTITTKDAVTKILESTGYLPNKTNPKVKRTVRIQTSAGVGISFVYGILIGNGGISMGNGSRINGSIYSNGNISGGNNETITGDAIVAGGTQPSADQQSDCSFSGSQCDQNGFIFGKSVSGDSRLDVAQSFKPSSTAVINKVSLRLKKFGSPPDITVRLLGDSNGKPDKSNVLTSGTLYASLVTDQFGFVDVVFNPNSTLTADTVYWIVLDTSNDPNKYWAWSWDLAQGYNHGSPAWSPDWQAKNPVWTSFNNDLDFKTWMGGVVTSISMNNGSVVQGNVRANTINGITVNKDAYYQTIINSQVLGTSHPNSTDPPPAAMPISQGNIDQWKLDAAGYGVSAGNVTGCPARMGPGKIVGNVTINNTCTVIVTTPIWITGNLSTGNSDVFKMDPSLGTLSGVMIVDGTTTFSNGDDLLGTGQAGSYLTLLSTQNTPETGNIAINTSNSSITGILYAPFGEIVLANNANFKEAVAWKIDMGTGTILTYDSGLINAFFSAGPGGSFSLVKGTYQVK